MGWSARSGGGYGKELRADWNAGDLGIAKPTGCGRKVHRCGLHSFAYQPVGHSRDRIWLKGHGGKAAQDRGSHRRTRSVPSDAENHVGAEVRDQPGAGEQAKRQPDERSQAGHQRNLIERAYIDQFQFESSGRHHPRFHPAGGADEKNFGVVLSDEFAGDCQSGNDVPAGAAASDEDS